MGETPFRPVKETTEQCKTRWTRNFQPLIGRKIVGVRWLTRGEAGKLGWDQAPIALTLDNGTILYPSQDDEGNGAGALFVCNGIKAIKLPEVAPVI